MKSIMMSIRPEWVAKILNGEKPIEIRKRFPKDYVGWVYICCTKDKKKTLGTMEGQWFTDIEHNIVKYTDNHRVYNGKVVARFWCDKVDTLTLQFIEGGIYYSKFKNVIDCELNEQCQLDNWELLDYLGEELGNKGYAIHISKLEIFDKPKELSEFKRPYVHCSMACDNNFEKSFCRNYCSHNQDGERLAVWCDRDDKVGDTLTKAPQSWQYVEVE